ncbi:MAG TPA: nitroreductase [Kofleriaceae bacterium]|jgi:nitroreductase
MDQMLDFLCGRRSAPGNLAEPGPTHAQLDRMLQAAGTVPDHGGLRPYRFAVIEGEGRAAFGEALAKCSAERKPDAPAGAFDKVKSKAFRSPTIIAIIASPKPGKVEVWEQKATAACAGYAITLAAHALGVGAVWKSVPFTRGTALAQLFNLTDAEEVLGFIHLGAHTDEPLEARPPIEPSSVAVLLNGPTPTPYR